MARSTEAVRALAHHLYADEPVVQERRSGSRLRETAGRADRPHQAGSGVAGLDFDQGPSGRDRGAK